MGNYTVIVTVAGLIGTLLSHLGCRLSYWACCCQVCFRLAFESAHAFTVTGGEVTKAKRLEKGKNVRWEIHVMPDSSGNVTIVLPVNEDCDAQGAICTGEGRKLSNSLDFTVSGPS